MICVCFFFFRIDHFIRKLVAIDISINCRWAFGIIIIDWRLYRKSITRLLFVDRNYSLINSSSKIPFFKIYRYFEKKNRLSNDKSMAETVIIYCEKHRWIFFFSFNDVNLLGVNLSRHSWAKKESNRTLKLRFECKNAFRILRTLAIHERFFRGLRRWDEVNFVSY